MKKIFAIIGLAMVAAVPPANAQYWEAANQLANVITPALQGGAAYKGSVEVMGLGGVGSSKLNHVEIATSQGFTYADWFYMGAGIGVDIVHSTLSEYHGIDEIGPRYYGDQGWNGWDNPERFRNHRTGVMIPVFTDFRFNIGIGGGTSMFIDLRLGASWLVGDRYIAMDNGWLGNDTQFYFRPSLGLRVPINTANPRQAVNFGIAYLMLTSNNNYWYYGGTNKVLSAVGASISFEW